MISDQGREVLLFLPLQFLSCVGLPIASPSCSSSLCFSTLYCFAVKSCAPQILMSLNFVEFLSSSIVLVTFDRFVFFLLLSALPALFLWYLLLCRYYRLTLKSLIGVHVLFLVKSLCLLCFDISLNIDICHRSSIILNSLHPHSVRTLPLLTDHRLTLPCTRGLYLH